ncbi:MAG: serine/threonine protein kinase [Actinobacteria bacterium]|nr:serine/threonine protein kinase [Actinomycetota bacterium]
MKMPFRTRAQPDNGTPRDASWGFREGDGIAPGRHAVRLLGGGVRFEAYLAWDDQLHSLIVVKMLRPDQVDEPAALAAIAAEARMLESLQHPVIVRAFDAVVDGVRPHLLLEYLDGPHLSTLLRTSAISIEQVLPLGLQLCSAVHYMGTQDVVHMDVKPRNVIMTGPPRLIDFSLALRTGELPGVSSPTGTPRYMAPEQCDPARFRQLGGATDVWGIGVTLYWALAQRSPFPEPSSDERAPMEERYPQLVHGPAPLPADVTPALAELVEATLAPRPEDRPAAGQVAAELEVLVAALPGPRLGRFRVSTRKGVRR